MTETIYNRMCVINEDYKGFTPAELAQRVMKGEAVIEKHGGPENLHTKALTEEELALAGTVFDYQLATDESLYEED